jgi:hypothetical protein
MIKLKIILTFFVLYCFDITLFAQDTPDDYMNRVNFIFANVDHSKVTTGLLSDYGLQVILPEYYDGTLCDSNEVDMNAFRTLYADMDYSRFNANCTLPGQSTVFNAITSNIPTSGQPVPIASMCINYNCFRSDAYTTGLVTVTNDQIFDVAGANPYETRVLFAAAPVQKALTDQTVQFVLKSALYYTNAGKTITSVAADMGDGMGFQTVGWDTPFSVTYSSVGNKVFVIKYTFSDATVLQTHGKIAVSFSNGEFKSAGGYSLVVTDVLKHTFDPVQSHSGGEITVAFGQGNADKIIRKPFIVAEGFDPWKIMSPGVSQSNMTIDNFISYDFSNTKMGAIGVPLTNTTLLNYLYMQGYDIIYLDYNEGTDDIKRNAALFEDVIKWVNNNKQGSEPNVVMGISMGGLVARYALRQLEIQGYDHQTKIYLSMDSPHNGANVPAGAQAALYHVKDLHFSLLGFTIYPADFIDEINQGLSLLNTMAAKQMLIYKASPDWNFDNTEHESFMGEYQSMGFPQQCYNVAISDGSGNGTPLYPAGTNLIDYSTSFGLSWWMDVLYNIFGSYFIATNYPGLAFLSVLPGSSQIKAEASINATPESPGNLYHGHIYVRKKILWFIPVNVDITNRSFNSVSTMEPVDGAPGGIYDLNVFTDLSAFPPGVVKKSQFCFVPAVSALALTDWKSYLSSTLNTYNFISNGQTNFQDYYQPMPAENNLHTSFYTPDNSLANYIKTILENAPPPCTTTTIQNINYTTSQTITGCNLSIQNVTIQNNCTVIFDATSTTDINGPFEVLTGSGVEIK